MASHAFQWQQRWHLTCSRAVDILAWRGKYINCQAKVQRRGEKESEKEQKAKVIYISRDEQASPKPRCCLRLETDTAKPLLGGEKVARYGFV